MKNLLPRTAALAVLVLLATACAKTEDAAPVVDTSDDNLLLSNSSGAVSDPAKPTNYLLVRPQYAVGYNRDQGQPIWVSWYLGARPTWAARPGRMIFEPTPACPAAGTR